MIAVRKGASGHPARSERYRDILAPLGLQDELRTVLRVRDACWGYICLHREVAQATFSRDEARFVQRLAPHLAEGLRTGLLRQACHLEDTADSPGLVILGADGAVAGMNDAAGRWLEDLGGRADGSDLPIEISAVATRLRHLDASAPAMPRLRVRARTGRWATLHASWMNSNGDKAITVILEEAAPAEVAPVIMSAYGLTDREKTICGLVCQGLPTRQIADRLHLTTDTVQDHLKSAFERPACTAAASSSPRFFSATTCPARSPVSRSPAQARSPSGEPSGHLSRRFRRGMTNLVTNPEPPGSQRSALGTRSRIRVCGVPASPGDAIGDDQTCCSKNSANASARLAESNSRSSIRYLGSPTGWRIAKLRTPALARASAKLSNAVFQS